jgi:hypothetical protein
MDHDRFACKEGPKHTTTTTTTASSSTLPALGFNEAALPLIVIICLMVDNGNVSNNEERISD